MVEDDTIRMRTQHPGGEALFDVIEGLRRERLQEPGLGAWRNDRDGLEQGPRGGAQTRRACENRVPHRVRDLGVGRRQYLRDEERVARGLPIEIIGVDAVRLGESGNGLRRQRIDPQPPHRRAGRELSGQDPQRMYPIELVAVAHEDEGGHTFHLPPEETNDIESRLVGPVDIFEHEHARCVPAQVVHQRGGDLVGLRFAVDELLDLASARLCDLDQWRERTRHVERVAGSPEDASRAPVLIAEAPQERRLPDPGLPRDQDEPASSLLTHIDEQRGQRVQLALPFEELRRGLARYQRGHHASMGMVIQHG